MATFFDGHTTGNVFVCHNFSNVLLFPRRYTDHPLYYINITNQKVMQWNSNVS